MTLTPSNPLDTARYFGLVPCAGKGLRALGTGATAALPKQYQPVAGRPMVLHTLAAFAAVPRIAACLLVVAPGDTWLADRDTPFAAGQGLAGCGGESRAASVRNGLNALKAQGARDGDWVLVHDAARCLVTPALIDRLIDACRDDAVGGLLAHPVPDTLKVAAGGRVAQTLPRTDKWLAQTPQMFRIGLLAQALAHAGESVTDEASAVEALGHAPRLVPGDAQNFKVTYPEDFLVAHAVLRARMSPSASDPSAPHDDT